MVCGPNQGSVPNNRLHQINPGVCSCFLLFLINYHPTTTPQHQHHNSTNTTTPTPHCCFHQRSGVSAQSPLIRFYPAVDPLKLCTTCGRSYFLLQKYFFTFKLHKNLKSCKKQHCLLYISHISQQPRNASVIPFPCIEKMSKMLLVKCMHCLSYNGLSA